MNRGALPYALFAAWTMGTTACGAPDEGADADEEGIEESSSAVTSTLVAKGSAWKYLDNGSSPAVAWRGLGFADATWKSGPAPLGYGDTGLATVVGFGPSASNKYITTYLRRSFSVANASALSSATLSVQRDDGVVVYVNGTEVWRSNMPGGAASATTLATTTIAGTDEVAFHGAAIPTSAFVTGTNVVAVELHQASAVSSDLRFDLELKVDAAQSCVAASSYAAPVSRGTMNTNQIVEASGLAASRKSPGVLFTHNDSGDSARFFAVSGLGQLAGTFTVAGATAIDWEDMAVGPCPSGNCVYIGDIGDNGGSRTNCVVYRVAEPNIAGGQTSGSLAAEKFPFAYPDGPHDAESLLVHPTTGNIYIIIKRTTGVSDVYRFPQPLQPNTKVTLTKIATMHLPTNANAQATAAAIHPCGDRFLLRTYSRVYEYRAASGQPFETAFAAQPVVLPAPSEAQGEAVEYALDGSGYFTLSEGNWKPLYFMAAQ